MSNEQPTCTQEQGRPVPFNRVEKIATFTAGVVFEGMAVVLLAQGEHVGAGTLGVVGALHLYLSRHGKHQLA